MEATGDTDTDGRLKNYYHKMGDMHVKTENYKSAYVYYTEAAEKYLLASRAAKSQELSDELKEKCGKVIKGAEICKKRFNEGKSSMHGALNLSLKTKKFKDLSLKEQGYIYENIDVYKELASMYTEAYGKTKDNQYLHAIFASNREAAFAYILASRACDEDIK